MLVLQDFLLVSDARWSGSDARWSGQKQLMLFSNLLSWETYKDPTIDIVLERFGSPVIIFLVLNTLSLLHN